jgi:hypothetical protein
MKKTFLSIAALGLAAAFPAAACQCGAVPDAVAAARQVPLVVSGRVESVRESWFGPRRTVTLRVARAWKGKPPAHLRLTLGLSNCDYPDFRAGEDYLIFAERPAAGSDEWTATRCKPTKPLRAAGPDLRLLQPPAPPTPKRRTP